MPACGPSTQGVVDVWDEAPCLCPLQVVFLHGLARRAGSMKGLSRHVKACTGLECHVIGYPSKRHGLAELAEITAQSIREAVGEGAEVVAVAHSMGGVVVRHIQDLPDAGGIRWQGICMIAPPNRGSRVARFFSQSWLLAPLFKAIFGPAAMQLGQLELTHKWPLPPLPCSIIAGTAWLSLLNPTSWLTWVLRLLPGPSDGTLSVEETKLPDTASVEFATVPAAHTFIMNDRAVKRLVVRFIEHAASLGGSTAE
mmetsp:Transcript_44580/g.113925  ORF Transcript_44580/g.113925 Transcript_44580/m.113925 type:complete len:254 (+) Transcript_44580:286-1047(+)